jgi:hypothetical protein
VVSWPLSCFWNNSLFSRQCLSCQCQLQYHVLCQLIPNFAIKIRRNFWEVCLFVWYVLIRKPRKGSCPFPHPTPLYGSWKIFHHHLPWHPDAPQKCDKGTKFWSLPSILTLQTLVQPSIPPPGHIISHHHRLTLIFSLHPICKDCYSKIMGVYFWCITCFPLIMLSKF